MSGRLATVSGAVLLGGASSRMGRDKALLEWEGEALVVRQARLLASLFDEVLLVGGEPPAAAPGRRVQDVPGARSALRGIVGALGAASTPWVLVSATDLPALSADLVLGLVALEVPGIDAVVPRTDRPEPLCALYRVESVLVAAKVRLARGELTMRGLTGELRVTWLEGEDLDRIDGGAALANVNTPEEWQTFREARA